MASAKRIGFSWGDDKITLVEFEKNTPLQIISLPISSQISSSSPFSSNFTEEIQVTTLFQKALQDYKISTNSFYVSLPMKDVILRSFVIPYVKSEEIQDAVKFEARKYLPIDIQELNYVFSKTLYSDSKSKRLQIVFFAVRKETLEKNDRIFKQVGAEVTYCEPCVVSLTKMLLFKKEIKVTDHVAFLILEKDLGRICFIDQGIPQFVREFPVAVLSALGDSQDTSEAMNLKVLNEVGNSFDFYARQFNGERIDQMLVSSELVSQELFNSLETELKLKLRKVSPVVTLGGEGRSDDMDAIYAMGACVDPAIESLEGFNFIKSKAAKPALVGNINEMLSAYMDVLLVLVFCVIPLIAVNVLFGAQLKVIKQQYDQLALKEGPYLNSPIVSIQSEAQGDIDKLSTYKNVRTKSDVANMILKIASHLPKGAYLRTFSIKYASKDVDKEQIEIDMAGVVSGDDADLEVAGVNKIYSDIKNDKDLAKYVKTINLVSLDSSQSGDKPVASFIIHCA